MPTNVTFIGKYQVVDRLAQGGMGTLYLARDPGLDRLVAVKVIRGDFENEELRERFSREARAVSRLRHPNIVTIFEYGEHREQPFIAMEYVAGESLGEIIERRATVPLIRKLQMLDELCAGMAHAHRVRIIHRDLKPANIMVDSETNLIKILDFGIARIHDAGMTAFSQIVGTPRYMSPEQAGGGRVDHRSDIFAIGAVSYELLSYQQAFDGDSQIAVLDKILRADPAPLAQICPELHPSIVRIVNRALEKDPAHRYQDLDAMRADIGGARERVIESQSEDTLIVPAPIQVGPPARRSDQLEKRRASQIQIHLDAAARALDHADYEAALESCEQVLLLDETNAQALTLHERAAAGLEQRILQGYVQQAREHLSQQALTQAEKVLADALNMRANDPGALALQREIQQARRDAERASERAAAAQQALARAQACLAEGAFESALRDAAAAQAYDPDATEPRVIKERALAAIAQRTRDQEDRRRAVDAVQAARREFEAGHHTAAISALDSFEPSHPLIDAARDALQREREAIAARHLAEEQERRRKEEEERRRQEELRAREAEARRREEEEAQRQQEELRRRQEDERRQEEARRRQEELRAREAEARRREEEEARRREEEAEVRRQQEELRRRQEEEEEERRQQEELRAREAEARRREEEEARRREQEAEVRRQQEELRQRHEDERRQEDERRRQELERERRLRQVEALLAHAQNAIDSADYHEALKTLSDAETLEPAADGIQRLRDVAVAQRAAAAAAALRRRQVADHVAEAGRLFNTQHLESASVEIDAALAIDPNDAAAREILRRIQAAREEQRRLEDLERLAHSVVQQARGQFELGNIDQARALLESFEPKHPVVTAAMAELQARTDALARARAVEEERRRSEEAAKREQERWVAARLSTARVEVDEGRFDDALRTLADIQRQVPQATGIAELRQEATSARARAIELARRRLEVERGMARALDDIHRGAWTDALRAIDSVLEIEADHPAALELRATVIRSREEQRRAEEALRADLEQRRAERHKRIQLAIETIATHVSRGELDLAERALEDATTTLDARTELRDVRAQVDALKKARARQRSAPAGASTGPRAFSGVRSSRAAVMAAATLLVLAVLIASRWAGRTPQQPSAVPQLTVSAPLSGKTLPFVQIPLPNVQPARRPERIEASIPSDTARIQPQPGGNPVPGGTLPSQTQVAVSEGPKPVSPNTESVPSPSPPLPTPQPPPNRPSIVAEGPAAAPPLPQRPQEVPTPSSPPPPAIDTRPPPPIDTRAADTRAIEQVLAQYTAAYNARDPQAVARVVPNQSIDTALLAEYRSYRVVLVGMRIELQGDYATVTCVRQIDVVIRRGNQSVHQTSPTTFKLRRTNGSWVIDSVSAK